MDYTVVYSDAALKQLRQMEKALARRVMRCADELEVDPYPAGAEPVADLFTEEDSFTEEESFGHEEETLAEGALYRIRCEGYRVVFEVEEEAESVIVWAVEPPLSEQQLLAALRQIGDEPVAKIVRLLAEKLSGSPER
jgi:mRNA-degrading endonuclease RelE of RelBE toxin-antitoxin system